MISRSGADPATGVSDAFNGEVIAKIEEMQGLVSFQTYAALDRCRVNLTVRSRELTEISLAVWGLRIPPKQTPDNIGRRRRLDRLQYAFPK